MSVILGVDVGGTKIAVGPVDSAGTLLAKPLHSPSLPAWNPSLPPYESSLFPQNLSDTRAFLKSLGDALQQALDEYASFNPVGIGLACAGAIDLERRLVVDSPNLPLRDTPLAELLGERLGLPVILENDANAALLAETTVGVAKGLQHVVFLSLGTGVGGGLLLNGQIYRGTGGGAAELGHAIICAEGEQCNCGARGCLEVYASGRALARYAARWVDSPTGDPEGILAELRLTGCLDAMEVGRLALEGYPGAVAALEELGHWLGCGLVGLSNTFNPQMVVIGGGVGELGELILAPARQYLLENAMFPGREQVQVAQAALGNEAGMVGAGLAAWGMKQMIDK